MIEVPYTCYHCGGRSATLDMLKNHIETMHNPLALHKQKMATVAKQKLLQNILTPKVVKLKIPKPPKTPKSPKENKQVKIRVKDDIDETCISKLNIKIPKPPPFSKANLRKRGPENTSFKCPFCYYSSKSFRGLVMHAKMVHEKERARKRKEAEDATPIKFSSKSKASATSIGQPGTASSKVILKAGVKADCVAVIEGVDVSDSKQVGMESSESLTSDSAQESSVGAAQKASTGEVLEEGLDTKIWVNNCHSDISTVTSDSKEDVTATPKTKSEAVVKYTKFKKPSRKRVPSKKEYIYCLLCEYKSVSKPIIKRHLYAVHGKQRNLQCPYCNHKTAYPSNLKWHLLKHKFKCPHCEFRSTTRKALEYHESNECSAFFEMVSRAPTSDTASSKKDQDDDECSAGNETGDASTGGVTSGNEQHQVSDLSFENNNIESPSAINVTESTHESGRRESASFRNDSGCDESEGMSLNDLKDSGIKNSEESIPSKNEISTCLKVDAS